MNKDGQMVAFLVQKLTMDAYDGDGNGQLDRDESARLRADGAQLYEARKTELIKLYDKDVDGNISAEEHRAAMRELFPHRPQRPHRAGNAMPPPPMPKGELPPPQPNGKRHERNTIHRLLDTHYDSDILRHLAPPQTEGESLPTPLPCAPSTPSKN